MKLKAKKGGCERATSINGSYTSYDKIHSKQVLYFKFNFLIKTSFVLYFKFNFLIKTILSLLCFDFLLDFIGMWRSRGGDSG